METLQYGGVRCRLRGGQGTRRCCLTAAMRAGETARRTLAAVNINNVPLPTGLVLPCGLMLGEGIALPHKPAPAVGARGGREVRILPLFKDVEIIFFCV